MPLPSPAPTRFLEAIPADLHAIAHQLASLTGRWNVVEIVTASPESRQREQERFFEAYGRGDVYHPRFDYHIADAMTLGNSEMILLELLTMVRTYRPHNRAAAFAARALRLKIQDDLATVWLVAGMQQRNERLIGQALRSKYGGTDAALIRAAKADFYRRIEEARTQKTDENLSTVHCELSRVVVEAPVVKDAFEWALREYDMLHVNEEDKGFRVQMDETTAFIDVRDKSLQGPTVFIPENKSMMGDELIALIAHEIEGHARQTVNGELLLGVWHMILRLDDETFYEGLAMRYENDLKADVFGTDARPSSLYAFAIHNAERGGSFHAVFDVQVRRQLRLALGIHRPHPLPPRSALDPVLFRHAMDAAWNTTYRVMRGHTDMSNTERFAMPKDLAYLRGWLLDHRLRDCDRSHFNECGIMTHRGMELLAGFGLREEHIPIPFKNIAMEYARKLLPEMKNMETAVV